MSLIRKITALSLALSLACMSVPAAAIAAIAPADTTTGTVSAGNGWVLAYSIEDGEATITGVDTSGEGQCVIPSSAGGAQVTTIGEKAFFNSALTSVVIPNTVWGIEDNAFRSSTSLTEVLFEGSYAGYLGQYAFCNCSALVEFACPALLGSSSSSGAVGKYCFQNCTSLTTIYWLAGRADPYDLQSGTSGLSEGVANWEHMTAINRYFTSNDATNGCSSLTTFVFYTQAPHTYHGSVAVPSAGTNYHTIDFFESEEAYEAATIQVQSPTGTNYDYYDNTQAVATVTYKSTTKIASILAGSTTGAFTGSALEGLVAATDEVPSAAEVSGDADAVWLVSDSMLTSSSSTLSDTCYATPVNKYDFTNAWIETTTSIVVDDDTGVVDLGDLTVYAADGSVLDSADYELHYLQCQYDSENETYYAYNAEGHEATAVSAPATVGKFVVYATCTVEGHEGSQTPVVSITVAEDTYEPTVNTYAQASAADSLAVANKELSQSGVASAQFNVLVDSEDTAALLVAASIAGLGGGIVAIAEGGTVSTETKYALNASGAAELVVLESVAKTIPDSTLTNLRSTVSALKNGDFTRFPLDEEGFEYDDGVAVSASELALSVYEVISAYGPLQENPYDFSDVAIVASASNLYGVSTAAQLAYQAQAAVFFTESDGSISASTLAALAAGGFANIYVLGPTGYVSSAVQASVAANAGGAQVTRILNASSAYENSQQMAELLCASYGSTIANLVVVDACNVLLATTAATYAARMGGICFTTSTTADTKAVATYISAQKRRAFETITYISSTDYVASSVSDSLLTDEVSEPSQGTATEKAKQSITISPAKKALKAKKLKKKAASFTVKVKGAKGSIKATSSSKKVVAKVSGSKVKITVKKGCKKGKYKVVVQAKAKGNYAASAKKTITITVK